MASGVSAPLRLPGSPRNFVAVTSGKARPSSLHSILATSLSSSVKSVPLPVFWLAYNGFLNVHTWNQRSTTVTCTPYQCNFQNVTLQRMNRWTDGGGDNKLITWFAGTWRPRPWNFGGTAPHSFRPDPRNLPHYVCVKYTEAQ